MEQLLLLLKSKGVVNDSELSELKTAAAEAESAHSLIDTESGGIASANLISPQATQSTAPEPPRSVQINAAS